MLATCLGQKDLLQQVADLSLRQKHYSVAFLAFLNLQDVKNCLEILLLTYKYSEAMIFCKNYCPSKTTEVFNSWKKSLEEKKNNLANRIANPLDHTEEYPDYQFLMEVEEKV